MSKLHKWICSFLQNLGIGFFVAGLVILINPSAIGANGIVWATVMTVLGSLSIGGSLVMVILDSLPTGD